MTAAVRLREVDLTGIRRKQPTTAADSLRELGVRAVRLMGGMALHNDLGQAVARERNARDASADNPGLLASLRDAGAPVQAFGDFRQLEAIRTTRVDPAFGSLVELAIRQLEQIGEQHHLTSRRTMGGDTGFQVSLITCARGERVLGFLSYDDTGNRIFLSRDGSLARIWAV